MPHTPIRVLVADDHRLFRDGLRVLLTSAPDLELVGEAGDGEEVVAKAAAVQPDVILMDLQLPRINGVEATRRILQTQPNVNVLVLTMFEDTDTVLAAMRAGARGYVLKDTDEEALLRSVRAVASGEALFGPGVAERLMRYLAEATPPSGRSAFPELTEREREVLSLLAQGLSNQEVAERMGISLKTARNHVSNILARLQVADRTEAVARARAAGLGGEKKGSLQEF
ncbi:MAG TPA: response regulator transcription factor [Anaerolineales bacterium]|nr:response regulator transcription factor [Anaerolineales bacterium]